MMRFQEIGMQMIEQSAQASCFALCSAAGAHAISGGVSGSLVMAAIEEHKRAFAAAESAYEQLDDLEKRLPDEVMRKPRVQVGRFRKGEGYEPIWAECPADIDHHVSILAGIMSPERMAGERARLTAEFWSDVDALNILKQSSGLSKMQDLADIAEETEAKAMDGLLATEIRSLEESRALAGYLREHLEASRGRHDWGLVGRCFLALAGAGNALEPA
jgi:hypothetical protein